MIGLDILYLKNVLTLNNLTDLCASISVINPANENATIRLNIEKLSKVTIEAIDFTGKRVQTIFDHQIPEGEFQTSWNVSDLAAGVYYVRILVEGSGVDTKKVIVF